MIAPISHPTKINVLRHVAKYRVGKILVTEDDFVIRHHNERKDNRKGYLFFKRSRCRKYVHLNELSP